MQQLLLEKTHCVRSHENPNRMGDAIVMMPSKPLELPVPAKKLTIMNALCCGFHGLFVIVTLVVPHHSLAL